MPWRCASSGAWSWTGWPSSTHLAGVRPVDAGQQLDAGALAGAVLAQQGQHLARLELQRHVADGDRAAEGLGDASQRSDGPTRLRRRLAVALPRLVGREALRHAVPLASRAPTMEKRNRRRKRSRPAFAPASGRAVSLALRTSGFWPRSAPDQALSRESMSSRAWAAVALLKPRRSTRSRRPSCSSRITPLGSTAPSSWSSTW